MLEAVRFAGGLPDGHPDYADARIRTEITDTMRTVFARSVVKSRGGYWLQPHVFDLTADTAVYQIPHRALAGGVKSIHVRPSSTANYYPLEEVYADEVASEDTSDGPPRGYYLLSDFFRLVPIPDSSDADGRIMYYVRPPRMVQEQTTAGIITAINTSTRVALMATTPTDRDTGNAITSSTVVDVVSTTGSHELHVVGATLTNVTASTSVTFAAGTDLSRVVVGDAVRAADQSEWPMLPREFHRTLADATAAVILAGGIGALEKSGGLSGKVAKDIERFESLIQPRVKDNVKKLRPRFGALRGNRFRIPVAPSS